MTPSTTWENLNNPIIPAKDGNFYNSLTDEYISMDEECENSDYYINGVTNEYPDGFFQDFYTISDIYTVHGSKGITLSIFPFSYYPNIQEMEVLLSGVFEINFNNGNVQQKIRSINNDNTVLTKATRLFFDCFQIDSSNDTPYKGTYLIVAAHEDTQEHLQQYVDYKINQGYDVEVVYLDEYGYLGNANEIRNLIYSTSLGTPDFVLFIGTINEIPPFSGDGSSSNPYSDDGYHDYVGRWDINSSSSLTLENIIHKTIDTEQGYTNFPIKAALFSGIDSHSSHSRWFYKDIEWIGDKVFNRLGITYTLCDGRLATSNFSAMQTKMTSTHQHIFIYSGHGSSTGIADPFNYTTSNLSLIQTSAPYPMGFGFACSLNSYNSENSTFAEKWVSSVNGGVTFYGSTTTTTYCSDRYLSRHIFKMYKKIKDNHDNYPISMWLREAERSYYKSLYGSTRERQVLKYNLYGDPTLYIFGLDSDDSLSNTQRYLTKRKTINSQKQKVAILDISGNIIYSTDEYFDGNITDILSSKEGLFIIIHTMEDGQVIIDKIIK